MDAQPTNTTERRDIEARLRQVDDARRELARAGERLPWLLTSALAALPAGALWGVGVGLAVLATAVLTSALAWYLVWAHQHEYAAQRDTLRDALAHGSVRGRRSVPWRVEGKALNL